MLHLHALPIRNVTSSLSGRDAWFWLVTALVALLLPSPLAAPVLLARLRRQPHQE